MGYSVTRSIIYPTFFVLSIASLSNYIATLEMPWLAQVNTPSKTLFSPSRIIARGIKQRKIIKQIAQLQTLKVWQRKKAGITRCSMPNQPLNFTVTKPQCPRKKGTGSLHIKEPDFLK